MKVRKIAILAILMAMNIVISIAYIPVGPNLRIYFTFIITMMISCNFNLGECIIYATLEDLLSFFIFPSGPFFPGYTLTAIAGITIYNLFLSKKVTVVRTILAKACVNIFVNVGLGSLWSHVLYSKAFIYYAGTSIVKNLLLLPVEIIIFLAIYKFTQPTFNKYLNKGAL